MPHDLLVQPFTANLLPEVIRSVDCGLDRWARVSTDWIHGTPPNSVIESMARWGTRAWLYRLQSGQIVGFGSLGPNTFTLDGQKQKILYIPQMGIDARFRGGPAGVPENEKYAKQLVRHLITEALKSRQDEKVLGLLVHSDNVPARRLYDHFDFKQIEMTHPSGYLAMVRYLAAP